MYSGNAPLEVKDGGVRSTRGDRVWTVGVERRARPHVEPGRVGHVNKDLTLPIPLHLPILCNSCLPIFNPTTK